MPRLDLPAVALLCLATTAIAQESGIKGDWRTPDGAMIRVSECGTAVCASILQLEPNTPSRVDGNNPDLSKRAQKLCGLQIGYGFHLVDANHAEDGRLYDPKSGKTYRGSMTSAGAHLSLRGYVGLKAFGRTETWTRATEKATTCS